MLKEARIAAGLSQQALANKTGISVRTIQHYEQGIRNVDGAKISALIDMAIALKCEISDILENTDLVNKCKEFGI